MNTWEDIYNYFGKNEELAMAYILKILPEFRHGIRL